jgi:O-antigen polymerase
MPSVFPEMKLPVICWLLFPLLAALFFVPAAGDLGLPEGYIVGKNHIFNLVSILFISCGYLAIIVTGIGITAGLFEISLLVFCVFSVLSLISQPTAQNYNLHTASLCLGFLDLLVFRQLLRISRYFMDAAILSVLCVGFFEGVTGQLQLLGFVSSTHELFNLTGTFHNPGPFSIFVVTIFILSLALLILKQENNTACIEKVVRSVALADVIIIGVLIPSTGSRTSWVGLACAIVFLLYQKFLAGGSKGWFVVNRAKYPIYFIGLISFATIASFWLFRMRPSSANGRLLVWRIVVNNFGNIPPLGLGHGRFKYEFGKFCQVFFSEPSVRSTTKLGPDYVGHAFNEYLQMFVELGYPGIFVFATLVILSLGQIFNSVAKGRYKDVAGGGIVFLLLSGLFSYPFQLIGHWFLFTFLLFVANLASPDLLSLNRIKLAGILLGIGLFYCGYLEFKMIRGRLDWAKGQYHDLDREYEEAGRSYQSAIALLPDMAEVYAAYGKFLQKRGDFPESIKVLREATLRTFDPLVFINLGDSYRLSGDYGHAEHAYIQSIDILPNRLYGQYRLAKLYEQTGDREKALEVAQRILVLPVERDSPASIQMRDEMVRLQRKLHQK